MPLKPFAWIVPPTELVTVPEFALMALPSVPVASIVPELAFTFTAVTASPLIAWPFMPSAEIVPELLTILMVPTELIAMPFTPVASIVPELALTFTVAASMPRPDPRISPALLILITERPWPVTAVAPPIMLAPTLLLMVPMLSAPAEMPWFVVPVIMPKLLNV